MDCQFLCSNKCLSLAVSFMQLEKYAKVVSDCERVVELEPKSGIDDDSWGV